MKWTLQQISDWTSAKIISTHETKFSELGTDTRQDLSGKIFIALKGEAFDAHEYLDQAVRAGAAALIVHRLPEKFKELGAQVSLVLVEDTLSALQKFAHEYRKTLKTQIIGITGSSGKTTTKEFAAQIISRYKKVHYNKGSFNNHWGVPLTLLDIPQDADFALVEMGMNHAGELTQLVKIAEPDIVVCTMVGTAHLEFFGSQAKIAEAKSEIYLESKPNCTRIFNQDQDLTFDMMYPVARKFSDSRMLSFSQKNTEADVFFKIVELKAKEMKIAGIIAGEEGQAVVSVFGEHNVINLMAAATIAYACKISADQIWKALLYCKTTWGRGQFIETKIGAEILFDGYNSNPDSMKALLESLSQIKCSGKKLGAFGQMRELGAEASKSHFEVGELAGRAGFSKIYFMGENHLDFKAGVEKSGYLNELKSQISFSEDFGKNFAQNLSSGDLVVIKGSRGLETEKFIPFCQPIGWGGKA